MSDLVSLITQFVQQVLVWIGLVIDFVVSEPLLLIFCVAVPIVSYVVDIFRRILHS